MTKYMTKYEELKQKFITEGKEEYFNIEMEYACEQVQRQTDYTKENAINKLIEHELNTVNVIKEWMGIPLIKNDTPKKSPNQMIYDEFRSFLDEAAINYYKK